MSNGLASRQLSPKPRRCRPLRRKTASQDEQVPVLCGVRLVGLGKQTVWNGKGGPRRLLSSTVAPRPSPPEGEAPHRGSSKARLPPGNLSEKDRRQGKRLRVWDPISGRGKQRSEGLTLSYLRGTRRDCSQATDDARRGSPNEETQTFPPPQPLLLDFQGTTFRSTTNRPGRPTLIRLSGAHCRHPAVLEASNGRRAPRAKIALASAGAVGFGGFSRMPQGPIC
jgi:hypothetical protein